MLEREVFLAALEIKDAVGRERLLAEHFPDDAPARQRVMDLLQAADKVGSFLELPAAREGVTSAYANREQVDLTGTIVAGKYKLREKLGEGGMGSVWVADQLEPVQRRVALKLIKINGDSRSMLARFEQERQALALMDHPNIAKVFDAGVDSEAHGLPSVGLGQPYFVMELIKGVPLTKYCDDARLTMQQRLELFIPVCQAVQHAHQKGVIHRDLKPGNILIGLYDGKPVPKVIDFGVAKATGSRLTDQTIYTEVGSLVGTLEYMSPEQAELNNLDIDTRSDIYALGVILYELLTGSVPFARKEMAKAGLGEMLRVIKEVEPPKPSTKLSGSGTLPSIAANRHTEPTKLTRLVKGDLDWIVMKALEKDRARRYETANGFAADVMRYLSGEAVTAVPPSAGYRLKKFVKRNQTKVIAAALVLLALMAGIVGTTWALIEARSQRDRAEQSAEAERLAKLDIEVKRAEAERQKTRAEAGERLASERLIQVNAEKKQADDEKKVALAVRDFLQNDLLGQADPDRNSRDKQVTVEELLRRAEKSLVEKAADGKSRFSEHPLTEAALLLTMGKTFFKLGLLPEAERNFKRSVELRRKVLGESHPDTLASQEALADFLNLGPGRFAEAEQLAILTWKGRHKLLGPNHVDTLDSLDTYAQALHNLGKKTEAAEFYRQCLEGRQQSLGKEHPDTLITMNNRATLLTEIGQWAESIALLREVLRIRQRDDGDSSGIGMTVFNLAIALHLQGDLAEAEQVLTRQVEWSSRINGLEHPLTDRLRGLYIRVWVDQGELNKAITLGQEIITLRKRLYPPGHYLTTTAQVDLGRALTLAKRYKEAESVLTEARSAFRKSPPPIEFFAHWTEYWYAVCLSCQGRHTEAEPLLLNTEQKLRTNPMTPPRYRQQILEQLVQFYTETNKPDEVKKWQAEKAKMTAPAR